MRILFSHFSVNKFLFCTMPKLFKSEWKKKKKKKASTESDKQIIQRAEHRHKSTEIWTQLGMLLPSCTNRTIFSLLLWQKGTLKITHQQSYTDFVVQTIFYTLETHREIVVAILPWIWMPVLTRGPGATAVSSCNRITHRLRSRGLCRVGSAAPHGEISILQGCL